MGIHLAAALRGSPPPPPYPGSESPRSRSNPGSGSVDLFRCGNDLNSHTPNRSPAGLERSLSTVEGGFGGSSASAPFESDVSSPKWSFHSNCGCSGPTQTTNRMPKWLVCGLPSVIVGPGGTEIGPLLLTNQLVAGTRTEIEDQLRPAPGSQWRSGTGFKDGLAPWRL